MHSTRCFFNIYLPIARAEWLEVEGHSEFENFSSPNYSKFAVECDWISKISQIRTKIDFFKKNYDFFSKLVKMANLMIEFLENALSTIICDVFWKNREVFKFGEITKFA